MAASLEHEIRTLRSLFWSARDPGGHGFAPLADAYRRAGELDQAVELLREGLGRLPDFASGHFVAGLVHGAMREHEEAARCFERVLELDSANLLAKQRLDEARRGEPVGEPPSGTDDFELASSDFELGASLDTPVDDLLEISGGFDGPMGGLDTVEETGAGEETADAGDDLHGGGEFDPWGSGPEGADALGIELPEDDLAMPGFEAEEAEEAEEADAGASPARDAADTTDGFDALELDDLDFATPGPEPDASEGQAPDIDLPELDTMAELDAITANDAGSDEEDAEAFDLPELNASPADDEEDPQDGFAPSEIDDSEDRSATGSSPFGDIETPDAGTAGAAPADDAGLDDASADDAGLDDGSAHGAPADDAGLDDASAHGASAEDGPVDDGVVEPVDDGVVEETARATFGDDEDLVRVRDDADARGGAGHDVPDDEDLYTRTMGELYARQGLFQRSVEVFEHLLECDPENREFRTRLKELRALAASRSERSPEAIPVVRADRSDLLAGLSFKAEAKEEAGFPGDGSAEGSRAEGDAHDGAGDAEEDVESLAPQWTGVEAGEVDVSTPFVWTPDEEEDQDQDEAGAEGRAAEGRPITSYFEDLLAWVPNAVSVASLAPDDEGAGPGGASPDDDVVSIEALAPDGPRDSGAAGRDRGDVAGGTEAGAAPSPADEPDDEDFESWLDRVKP